MKLQLNYVLFLVIFGMLTWIIVDMKNDDVVVENKPTVVKPAETKTKIVYQYPPSSLYSPWYNSYNYYPGLGFDYRYGGRLGHRRHHRV